MQEQGLPKGLHLQRMQSSQAGGTLSLPLLCLLHCDPRKRQCNADVDVNVSVQVNLEQLQSERDDVEKEFEEIKRQLEEDTDKEIEDMKER